MMKKPNTEQPKGRCECFAHSEDECACGNYPSDKVEGRREMDSYWKERVKEAKVSETILDIQEEFEESQSDIRLLQSHRRCIADAITKLLLEEL
ncbi:MAG: hypothetical protein DRR06_19905 [Gammaproteobacteria bacterium]|nr:MAG: hypothetical protein DRR06_19905 [Gammaproteobacteria bacterium]